MAPTSNENMENEWVPNFDLQNVKKSFKFGLELNFIQTDSSTVRNAKFKKELRHCLALYREALVQGPPNNLFSWKML